MSYYIAKNVEYPFEEAVEKTKEALKEIGFGVATTIDMKANLKNSIDKEINPYLILGACHPQYAARALEAEDNIGLMLPCNVLIREDENGKVEVSAIDPMEAMAPVGNPKLEGFGAEVRDLLKKAISSL